MAAAKAAAFQVSVNEPRSSAKTRGSSKNNPFKGRAVAVMSASDGIGEQRPQDAQRGDDGHDGAEVPEYLVRQLGHRLDVNHVVRLDRGVGRLHAVDGGEVHVKNVVAVSDFANEFDLRSIAPRSDAPGARQHLEHRGIHVFERHDGRRARLAREDEDPVVRHPDEGVGRVVQRTVRPFHGLLRLLQGHAREGDVADLGQLHMAVGLDQVAHPALLLLLLHHLQVHLPAALGRARRGREQPLALVGEDLDRDEIVGRDPVLRVLHDGLDVIEGEVLRGLEHDVLVDRAARQPHRGEEPQRPGGPQDRKPLSFHGRKLRRRA